MSRIFSTEVSSVAGATSVRSLNDDSLKIDSCPRVSYSDVFDLSDDSKISYLRLDVESGELFLSVSLTVVAWINTNLNLSIKTSIDI